MRVLCLIAAVAFALAACSETADEPIGGKTTATSRPIPRPTPSEAATTGTQPGAPDLLTEVKEIEAAALCQQNLIKIEGAVDQWAVEFDRKAGTTVTLTTLLEQRLLAADASRCPRGGAYPSVLTIGRPPTCDYKSPDWFDTKGGKWEHKIPDLGR